MSKFGGLRKKDNDPKVQPSESPKIQQPDISATQKSESPKTQQSESPKQQKSESAKMQVTESPKPQKRGPGRPKGKRSDPNYRQVTAYIRTDTYKAARHRMVDEGIEFSELVEQLLSEWLEPPST